MLLNVITYGCKSCPLCLCFQFNCSTYLYIMKIFRYDDFWFEFSVTESIYPTAIKWHGRPRTGLLMHQQDVEPLDAERSHALSEKPQSAYSSFAHVFSCNAVE